VEYVGSKVVEVGDGAFEVVNGRGHVNVNANNLLAMMIMNYDDDDDLMKNIVSIIIIILCIWGKGLIKGQYCLEGNKREPNDKVIVNVWRDLELLILPFFSSCFTILLIIFL
jgi:hypothetical protein